MKAADIMTARVVSARADADVGVIAALMVEHGISAVPIVDAEDRVIGIVSEGDLMRRSETGTERRRGWWLRLLADRDTLAAEFVKAHGHKANDVMTREVVQVGEDTPLGEIVDLLERHRIKRVPVVRDGRLVGIVSRANLVRAFAAAAAAVKPVPRAGDAAIRTQLAAELRRRGFGDGISPNIIVSEGVVHLWGFFTSANEHEAIRVAAEEIPGVRGVVDHMAKQPLATYAM